MKTISKLISIFLIWIAVLTIQISISYATDYHIHPQVSPDGKSAAYYYINADFTVREIRKIDFETNDLNQFHDFEGSNPAYSPDGKGLAFAARVPDGSKIVIGDVITGKQETIFKSSDRVMHTYWSPDGQKISFILNTDEGTDIWMIRRDGTDLTRITETVENEFHPKWSHDGNYLVYDTGPNDMRTINRIDVNSGESVVMVPATTGWGVGVPSFSNDDSKLVYERYPLDGSQEDRSLWIMDVNTQKSYQLAEGNGIGGSAWLPDDSGLLYHQIIDDYSIFKINVDGTGRINLLKK
ncbi:hypothetical protein [Pseudemcibacter aquimaris]|uniref:hypothetical protein n=1 Tax=Pseudemcibacter aquimaris TaxID=2857064 RepID=UPI0020113BF2|nr:hypothetical protein [Pseudemcibacter aquimaris]MCC3859663.1 hypothetical protein [Pseudemcibacter aquimaris]WDU60058.1 hypothetical protein KW060_07280 [Pseudemcibacter aquimaris]